MFVKAGSGGHGLGCELLAWKVGVDLADEVALEAADDLPLGQAFGGASLDVGAGGFVVAHPDDGGHVEGAVAARSPPRLRR
jgi:hypothetical protein